MTTVQQQFHILSQSNSSQIALRDLLQSTAQLLKAEFCGVGIIHLPSQRLQTFVWQVTPERWLIDEAEFSAVMQSALTQVSATPEAEPFILAPDQAEVMIQCSLPVIAPLQNALPQPPGSPIPPLNLLAMGTHYRGHLSGVLVLMRSQSHSWTEKDVHLVKTVSNQVAITISQVQLEQQLRRQTRYQSLNDQLTAAIRHNQSLDQVFQITVEGMVDCLELSRTTVLLVKHSSPRLAGRSGKQDPKVQVTVECQYPAICDATMPPKAARSKIGQVGTSLVKQSFPMAGCAILQHAFENPGKPLILPALDDLTETCQSSIKQNETWQTAPLFALNQMPALVLMPIENQNITLGYLCLQSAQMRYWQPEELGFIKLVAAQLSTAIIQSRTLRQVHALVDERTAQLQRSLDVQAKLYEKTRQQVEQLRRMNEVMEEFLSTVSHELLTPLTSMKVAIRMLREASLQPEQRDRYLNILEQQCTQETRLINDLLTLQKLESRANNLQLQQVDLCLFLQDLQQSWVDRLQDRSLTLHLELPNRPLLMHTDPESLNRILVELLTNARKYSDPKTTISIVVQPDNNQPLPQVAIAITNTGAGIPPEEISIVFDKFRRGSGVTQQAIPGTGLGLALVKGLVAHLSGAIAVESCPLEESQSWKTCFTLTLPQSPQRL